MVLKENYGDLYTRVMTDISQNLVNKHLRRTVPPRVPEKLRDGSYVIDIKSQASIGDVPIVVPRASTLSDEELAKMSINSILPSSYGALTACAHLQTRILFCKYKLGLTPSTSEKQSIERTLRRLNREVTRTVETDGFLLVDRRPSPPVSPQSLEAQNTTTETSHDTGDVPSTSIGDNVMTVFIRFPLYLLFVFFIAFYDVLVDERFRRRVRRTISWTK